MAARVKNNEFIEDKRLYFYSFADEQEVNIKIKDGLIAQLVRAHA